MKVISIANQKGGTGKTTTTVNLGAGLALKGFKVLAVDLDIQCNTTHTLFRTLSSDEEGVCEVLLDKKKIDGIIRQTKTENLYLAPAGESLVDADINLASKVGREQALKKSLNISEVSTFDFVLIDTAPYLGLLTLNALVASDYVLIPVSCEYLPMLGLKWLISAINRVKDNLNSKLEILGFLLTMYDRRERITTDVEDILREQFGDGVFNTVIRINTKFKAAPSEQKTIFQYENRKDGRGTSDYERLTSEVLSRLGVNARLI